MTGDLGEDLIGSDLCVRLNQRIVCSRPRQEKVLYDFSPPANPVTGTLNSVPDNSPRLTARDYVGWLIGDE